jgi:mannose-6-phosphate isomerase-like protein (cupin superfamily)
VAFAFDDSRKATSGTINVDQVDMMSSSDKGAPGGKNGVYLASDTPASTKFVTGRFVLEAGNSPHAPHAHAEEEGMIIESGHAEIICDGKTTRIGPGSVMFSYLPMFHGLTPLATCLRPHSGARNGLLGQTLSAVTGSRGPLAVAIRDIIR